MKKIVPTGMHVPQRGRITGARKNIRKNRTLLLMAMPAILFFLVFAYLPMPGIYLAFVNFKYALGIYRSPFVGLSNFTYLFASGKLWQLTCNTVLYNIAFLAVGHILQISIAIMLNEVRLRQFRRVTQTMMFIPYFISQVLVGLFVYNIFNFDYGVANSLLVSLGLDKVSFYSMPSVWPFIIVACVVWQGTGYGSIIYFTALLGISSETSEAAAIDGANAWQCIRHIYLPALVPTIVILQLLAIGGILHGNFGIIYNIVGSMNSILWPTTDIIETYVYRSLKNTFNFSLGSAVGLYQSLFGFALIIVSNFLVRHAEPDYALF
jgi:putative aldouronate transport system permease protein